MKYQRKSMQYVQDPIVAQKVKNLMKQPHERYQQLPPQIISNGRPRSAVFKSTGSPRKQRSPTHQMSRPRTADCTGPSNNARPQTGGSNASRERSEQHIERVHNVNEHRQVQDSRNGLEKRKGHRNAQRPRHSDRYAHDR